MIEPFQSLIPEVHPEAYVHPSAVLIGEVKVGPGASIWPGAVLRGDHGAITIGARTSIQDGAVCHATLGENQTAVGEDVTVGHRAILHGCRVASHVIVGMGSIVMDDATVGEWTIVGAGAVIGPNKVIPSGSIVMGNPARVARRVTQADRDWIVKAAQIYVDFARRFRERVA